MSKVFNLFLVIVFNLIMNTMAIPLRCCAVGVDNDYLKLIISNYQSFIATSVFFPGKDSIYLQIIDVNQNKDANVRDSAIIKLVSALGADSEEIVLTETGSNTGVFENSEGVPVSCEKGAIGDGILQVSTEDDIITVIYSDNKKEKVLATVYSQAVIDNFSIKVDSPQIAGKPFKVEISAKDKDGNILKNYSGTLNLEVVYITPKYGKFKISPNIISSFTEGKAQIFATYPDAGKIKIIARGLNNRIGESGPIVFLPVKFRLETNTKQIVGREFSVEIIALSQSNEITPNYQGPAFIKIPNSSDSWIKRGISFKDGRAKIYFAYSKWGQAKFIVCDENFPHIRGISELISFYPYRFTVEIESPPAKRKKFYVEELFTGKITVLDFLGHKIPEYGGIVGFKYNNNVDMVERYNFGWHNRGEYRFYISAVSDEPFSIEAYDLNFPEANGKSPRRSVLSATIKAELISNNFGKANLRIKIVDKYGKIVRDDSSTVFAVSLEESIPDGSAILSGPEKVKVENGTANITLIDKQKESVTLYLDSEPYLAAAPLDIIFE